MQHSIFKAEHIAPCGMNCGACSAYLAFSHGFAKKRGKITHCSGCRVRGKHCAYLKGQDCLISKNHNSFCYECPAFPCKNLSNIDNRYQTRYGISFIHNLEEIRDKGINAFLKSQTETFLCRKCRMDVVSIHNKECFRCDKVANWRG